MSRLILGQIRQQKPHSIVISEASQAADIVRDFGEIDGFLILKVKILLFSNEFQLFGGFFLLNTNAALIKWIVKC